MKYIKIILAVQFFFHSWCYAQEDTIQARLILIGDAGSLRNGKHPVVDAVRNYIKLDGKTTILFLGDNLYRSGLPDDVYPTFNEARRVLDSQVTIAANTKAKVYFIPGNHDWDKQGPGGWNAIVREQLYIDLLANNNVKFYPQDGCPGPVEISLSNDVVLILMDSQWWLHPYDKPGIESDCPYKTKEEVLNQLDDILGRNSKKLVLFACHHPFKSYGIHGGYFTLKQHIFPFTDLRPHLYIPLPVIGSIYPITRSVFGTPQDLKQPDYANMIKDFQEVLRKYPHVIFLAGHEHNLQLIKDSSYYYIISGSGTNKTRVSKNKNELFGAPENGFATLEISKNKNVNVAFYTVDGDSVKNAYNQPLINFSKLPIDSSDTVRKVVHVIPFKDSAVAAAGEEYNKASGFKRFFLGNNYRKEWAIPVDFKVFDIGKEKGGFKVKSLGGGKQTKSLQLEDKNGKEWVLRTINKDPAKVIPENFRGTVAQDIAQDMISASHPYAALPIADLLKSVRVVEASPTYYFVPDDPAFGIYQQKFANTICMLEEREPTPDGSETKSTPKVLDKLYEDNDNRIDQEEVLRARLVDMLIADFDRHFDQWRWGSYDTGKGKVYYAIPKDRDQAFFYSDGLLIKSVTRQLLPVLKGFRDDIPQVHWLNMPARDFDRAFLNRLDKGQWIKITDTVHDAIKDSVITGAVKKMPPQIFSADSATIIRKLKNRREALTSAAIKYYNFLSKNVNIVGSNKKEFFKVTGTGDQLEIKVYKRTDENDTVSLMYNRIFNHHETREIRLYGLNDNDLFDIDNTARSKIKVRIIGGKGKDTFNINGHVHNYIYDLNTDTNFISSHSHSKVMISSDPHINDYSASGFKYNFYRFPRLNLGYNAEDFFMVGLGILKRTYAFRKEPFATEQRLSTLYAFNSKAYRLKYEGEFNEVFTKTDLLVRSEFAHPVLNNFFGTGNETVIDPAKSLSYYKVRYRYLETDVIFRRRINQILHIMAGPVIHHYWNKYEDNKYRILADPSLVGLDSNNIYSRKTYIGGRASVLINNLDNVLLPTRGINWITEFTSLAGVTKTAEPFTSLTSDMTVHAALSDPARVVAVLKLGGGHIFSKHYEYFQALNLGANNILRGFRKNRFSGNSLAYGSMEFRVKLFDSKSYIFPGPVGIIGFDDIGRVWVKGEDSKKWHNSYGGGFYYAAYNYALVSFTMSYSKEEKLFNFSLGTKFNVTF